MGINIGIDLGGTNVRVAIVNKNGQVEELLQEPTEAEKGHLHTIKKMVNMIHTISEGKKRIDGIGIGAPGPLDPKRGVILGPPNLPGWDEVYLVDEISQHFSANVYLTNDANAAALAEATYGSGKGYESVYYVTVSTGVGGGLVTNGQVFHGAQGFAGEIGNMIVQRGGSQYSNLNKGALEGYASGTAIGNRAKELHDIEGGAEAVFDLVREGNEEAWQIVDDAVDYLAVGIANVTHVVNPDVFVIGGGVMNAGDLVWTPLREKVKGYVYEELVPHINLQPSSLSGDAGVIGASLLTR